MEYAKRFYTAYPVAASGSSMAVFGRYLPVQAPSFGLIHRGQLFQAGADGLAEVKHIGKPRADLALFHFVDRGR